MAGRGQMSIYDDDDGGPGGSAVRWVVAAILLVALAAIGWFVLRPGDDGDDTDDGEEIALATTGAPGGSDADTTDVETTESTSDETDPTVEETEPTESTETTERTEVPETTEGTTTSTTAAPATTAGDQPYETLPDGSPAPVIAVFDVSSVTLRGAVPTQEAKDKLAGLAGQYAKPGQGNIDNQLTVNPAIPANVGVRVVELTSVRFPEGSSEVLPEHGLELDRVAAVMNALPNVTALVIGHADQRGEELANFAISEQRADAVVNYIASKGVAPSRLSSRAVGESDLLTLADDAAALALNRRTEFVLYGLLLA